MRRIIILFLLVLGIWFFVIPQKTSAESKQQSVEAQAIMDANKFLKGLKIGDLPEGKKILAATTWELTEYPVLIGYSTIFESMFNTDIKGLRGYKRLLQVSVQSQSGMELKKKYILISYKDPRSRIWRVLAFRESVDIEKDYNWTKENRDTFGVDLDEKKKLQYNYRSYGYWASLAGKLKESLEAYAKASELNRANPSDKSEGVHDDVYSQESFDEPLEIIRIIIGK